jgi:competence protein ComEC
LDNLRYLLAVSGQNVVLVPAGALTLAWLLGIGRVAGELGALAGIGAYVLAVGPQPSVIRAVSAVPARDRACSS